MHGLGVAALDGLRERALALEVVGVDDAHQAEVEEADAAVVEQQVVAGMRVAGRAARVLERAEEEAEDDLAEAVALGFVEALDLLEAPAARCSSVTSTRRRERPVSTGGTKTNGWLRQARAIARWFWASTS